MIRLFVIVIPTLSLISPATRFILDPPFNHSTCNYKWIQHPPHFMQNVQIRKVYSHKHLGIFLSNDCNWHQSCNFMAEKARFRISIIRQQKLFKNLNLIEKLLEIIYIGNWINVKRLPLKPVQGSGGGWRGVRMHPRKLHCSKWRDLIKASLRISFFSVFFFVSKGNFEDFYCHCWI